jgi:phosphoglycerate dehydrogenase-like enzyme
MSQSTESFAAKRSPRQNIVVAIPFTDLQRERLTHVAPEAVFSFNGKDTASASDVASASIVMGNLSPALLSSATGLQWVQLASAGADAYTAPGALDTSVALTNSVGAYGQAVSEHMLALLLSLIKKLNLYRDTQSVHRWTDHGGVKSLVGASVVILGLGDIGTHMASLLTALGAHVVGIRRHVPTSLPPHVERVLTLDQARADGTLSHADVVVSFLPGGGATHHLLDAEFFASMKPGSYFLNGGRGSVVDTDALREAVVSDHLAGAGLDVTDPEPLPATDPLWDVDNVFVTPHVAGGYHLPAVLDNVADICAANLRRFLAGEALHNVVKH